MKKLFLLLLLLTFGAFAQDNATINAMVQSNTVEQIKTVSDNIISSGSEKYIFYKIADSSLREQKRKVAIYTLASVTDNDNTKLSEEEKESRINIIWNDDNGVYSFKEVYGPEDMIKSFWNQTFTTTDTQYRVNKDLKYKIVRNEETYSILKSY